MNRGDRSHRGWLLACGVIAAACTRARAGGEAAGTAIDVAVGQRMSCAAQRSGQVFCWGLDVLAHPSENKFGDARAFRIAGLDHAGQIALGPDSLCAVDTGGRVRCSGTHWIGKGGAPYGDFKVDGAAQVALTTGYIFGGSHACALRRDGTVACWGSNDAGELGTGDLNGHKDPVDVAGVADAVEVSVGDGASCARQRGGTVLCWGRRLGLRDPNGDPLHPRKVPGIDDAVSLSSGGKLTCVARKQGSVVCWGHGAFGVPGRVQIDAPTPIPNVTSAVQVSVGAVEMACARTAAGGVVCWGSGALGDGKLSKDAPPVAVPGLRDVVQIAVGASAACARTKSGAVMCWGRNEMGDTGHPPQLQSADRPLPGRPRAARLAAGDDRTCLVGAAGDVSCRGPMTDAAPEPPLRFGPVAEVAVGQRHTCLRRPDGHVLCWGDNQTGQLGDGTTENRATPVPTVPPIDDARAIVAAGVRTCAVRATGALACWGGTTRGEGPVPTGGLRDAVAVALGRDFTCALRRGGEVGCWGGRFGAHAFGPELALAQREQPPPTLTDLSPARAIGAREDQLCALRKDGTVVCTGGVRGNRGWIGERNLKLDPRRSIKGATDGVALAVGQVHACLLRAGGGVACWGDGLLGQLGGGAPVTALAADAVAVPGLAGAREIASGLDHTCARLADGEVRCWGFDGDGRLTAAVASLRPGPVALP